MLASLNMIVVDILSTEWTICIYQPGPRDLAWPRLRPESSSRPTVLGKSSDCGVVDAFMSDEVPEAGEGSFHLCIQRNTLISFFRRRLILVQFHFPILCAMV
jgi:hypothetical protein